MSEQKSIADAELAGFVVNRADDYTLQLDLDTPEAEEQFSNMRWFVMNHYDVTGIRETVSKSGNKHVYLRMSEPLPPVERILLQAILGSDPKREFLSFRNVEDGKEDPIVLFELPAKALPAPECKGLLT